MSQPLFIPAELFIYHIPDLVKLVELYYNQANLHNIDNILKHKLLVGADICFRLTNTEN
mgnify:CR=1 FL=1